MSSKSALLLLPILPALLLGGCAEEPVTAGAATRGPVLAAIDGPPLAPLDVGRDDAKAAVVVFITTDCPIANSYAPELRAIRADYERQPLRFYLVHVDPDVTASIAAAHATDFDLPSPILLDPKQELVRELGAKITPEAVVVLPDGEIAYRGRIDDWWGDLGAKRPKPNRRELRDAIDAVLAGRPVAVTRTEAIGCDMPD